MNERRRKPTTGTRCPRPTLFDKWHGIFYIPVAQTRLDIPRPLFLVLSLSGGFTSCRHLRPSSGRAKAFIYPVMGEVKVLRHKADLNRRPVGPQSNTPTIRPQWPPKLKVQLYPGFLGGPYWGGGGDCENSPATCRPSPGAAIISPLHAYKYFWCFHTRARHRHDNDKTNVEPMHSYDALWQPLMSKLLLMSKLWH